MSFSSCRSRSFLARFVSWGVLVLGLAAPLAADQKLRVYTSEQVYGPFDLAQEQLQQIPAGIVPIGFEEPTFMVGYTTQVIDSEGVVMPREMHCHTMLMNPMGMPAGHHNMNSFPFKGVFSDGYTQEVILPKGFGIYFDPGETLDLIPMFNNRDDEVMQASMKVQAHFVRVAELEKPLTPIYSTVEVVTSPHLYMVKPGKDVREREFEIPYEGRIHAMGAHIHPYGRSIELIDQTSGETVWNAVGKVGEDGRLTGMPFYSNPDGHPFGPGQRFLLRATYDNLTDEEQDAMAGVFIFFSTPDGKPPAFEAPAGAAHEHGHGEHM